MNSTMVKVLIGVGVAGAVAAATYIVTKKPEKIVESVDEEGNVTQTIEEGESILDKIKKAAYRKAVKILAWAALHMQQLEVASLIIGVVGGIFTVVNEIMKFGMSRNIRNKVDFMYAHDMEYRDIWNNHMDKNAGRYEAIMNTLNDILQNMPVKPVKKGA